MKTIAPYQVFFPIGAISAFIAVSVWFAQRIGWFDSPVMFIHSRLISGGFLWSFIIGFLMTAVPRMTGTQSASKFELVVALSFMGLLLGSVWKVDPKPFLISNSAVILFIIYFGGRRLIFRKKAIPVFFSHVVIAMCSGLLGLYFYYVNHHLLGIHLYHVGTILLLVLGIGTRFFSFLSGLSSDFENSNNTWNNKLFHSLGVLNVVALYFAGIEKPWGYLLLTLISLMYLCFIWRVMRSTQRISPLKWAMRIVASTVPISFFLCWLYPVYFVTWMHILFIGGFGLVSYAVATRVILAHGAYSLDLEITTKALWWLLGLFLICIASRVAYTFTLGFWKTGFLHLAATVWCVAIGVWIYSFFKKIFLPGPLHKPSC